MADCGLGHFISYCRAARHGAPSALDTGYSRPSGRAARARLLRWERLLRQVAAQAGVSEQGGGGADAALAELSQAQLEAAATAAGAAVEEAEAAVYEYFVFKRCAELLSLQRRQRLAISHAVARGALLPEDADRLMRDQAAREGPPLDQFFDMGAEEFLSYVQGASEELQGELERLRGGEGPAGGDSDSDGEGLAEEEGNDGEEAAASKAALEQQLTHALARLKIAESVFSALPAGAASRPLALCGAEVHALSALACVPPEAARCALRDYAQLKWGSLQGARRLLEMAGAAGAGGGGGGGLDEAAGGPSLPPLAWDEGGGAVPRRRGQLMGGADEGWGRGAQEEVRAVAEHLRSLSMMSLDDYVSRLKDQLTAAQDACPPLGRARPPSAAARARSDARQLRSALSALSALPQRDRRRLERRPERALGAREAAAAAAAARVPVEVVKAAVEGYVALRMTAAEMLEQQE